MPPQGGSLLDKPPKNCIIKNAMSKEYEIEVTINEVAYKVCFTAEFVVEDHGIGPYEYWGARGVDKHEVAVCDEVEINSVSLLEDEKDTDISNTLDKKTLASIESYCDEYANENAPDVDDVSDRWDGYEEDYDPTDFYGE